MILGKALIMLILLVTIPRWAATLAQVDTWQIFGVTMTAIGEGIALELGMYYILTVYERVQAEVARYAAWWTDHDRAMTDQGKTNHKPEDLPEFKGAWKLMAVFYGLFALTVGSQTPFIMTQLTGEPVATLLERTPLWFYAFLLVVSPEVVTAGLAIAIHYDGVVKRRASNAPVTRQSWTVASIAQQIALIRAALRSNVATVPPTGAAERDDDVPEPVTIATVRAWIASQNGSAASVTRDALFAFCEASGMDMSDRSNRDKVNRWWRELVPDPA